MDEKSTSAVRRLPRNAAGLDARRGRLRGYATWTPEDLAEFEETLRAQRILDVRTILSLGRTTDA